MRRLYGSPRRKDHNTRRQTYSGRSEPESRLMLVFVVRAAGDEEGTQQGARFEGM